MFYYTVNFEKNTTIAEKDLLLTRLKNFESTTQHGAAQAARSESGQSERYHVVQENGLTLHFIGIRFNQAGRLIGAIVTGGDETHYFALEITETHDYNKTLVGNEDRLNNWTERLLHFVPYIPSHQITSLNESDTSLRTKIKVRHNKLIKLNPQQETLDEAALNQITFCFGPPGTGKTLIISGFLERCILESRPTLFMGPENKLIQFMQTEVRSILNNTQQDLAHFHTWDSFLNTLAKNAKLPATLIYGDPLQNETRQFITLDVFYKYLCPSHTPSKAIKSLLKRFSMEILFQEYQHVFLQPTWSLPEEIYLSAEAYENLGSIQSRIPKSDRLEIHEILKAFYHHVSNQPALYYDPIIASKHVYLHLLKNPFKPFGAIAIDEAQRFNPIQIACLLSTSAIEEGYVLIAADPLQTIDSQPLAFIRPLEAYFTLHHLSYLMQLTHLEITHRSSILVTQLTKIWRNMLLRLVGPDELKTFSQMQLDDRQIMGKISFAHYDNDLKMKIESDPLAMVLIPHQNASANAWAVSHKTTVNEFQGLSSKTIVLDGFCETYHHELHQFSKELETHDDPFNVTLPLCPARHFKSENPLPLEIIKVIKAMIIALSRAEEELIIINPHPLLISMIQSLHQQINIGNQASSLGVETEKNQEIKLSHQTTQQWFHRLKKHIDDQLIPQACDLLKRTDIWGIYTPQLSACADAIGQTNADKQAILQYIKTILFAPSPTTSIPELEQQSHLTSPQKNDCHSDTQSLENLRETWEVQFKTKWIAFAISLYKNPSKANLVAFFELKSSLLINCILFLPIENPRISLMAHCLGSHSATLKSVLLLKPALYCSKITLSGLLYPVLMPTEPDIEVFSGITFLTEDDGIDLFSIIVHYNPNLAQQLNGHVLCEPFDLLSSMTRTTKDQSILYNLCAGKREKSTLLKILGQNPRLASEITSQALLRTPIIGENIVPPPIIGLCEGEEGASIFLFLITQHPELINDLHPSLFLETRLNVDMSKTRIYPYTGISLLTANNTGLMVFNCLLRKNPLFSQYITADVLDFQIFMTTKKTTTLREIISKPPGKVKSINQCRQEIYHQLKHLLNAVAVPPTMRAVTFATATPTIPFFNAAPPPIATLDVEEMDRALTQS